VNPKTVARRVPFFAAQARTALAKGQAALRVCEEIYLDELITFEHTRCKPLAVCMAVSKDRKILAMSVSSMPPHGVHLRRIALKKYGKRLDLRSKGVKQCLDSIRPLVGPQTLFKSDQEPSYARLLARTFPRNTHRAFPSKRAVIAGQGELKDHSFDPLFAINHTFAMFRANLARLARRSWVTTKKAARLEDFLYIYAAFHNFELTAQAS